MWKVQRIYTTTVHGAQNSSRKQHPPSAHRTRHRWWHSGGARAYIRACHTRHKCRNILQEFQETHQDASLVLRNNKPVSSLFVLGSWFFFPPRLLRYNASSAERDGLRYGSILHYRGIDPSPGPIIGFVDMLKDAFGLLLKKRLRVDLGQPPIQHLFNGHPHLCP